MKIRQIREDDSENYIELCKRLDQETQFMMLEPDERTINVQQQRDAINSLLATGNSMIFVAEDNGKLVGYIGAYGGEFRRNKHKVYIVIGILQEYAGKGIGTSLFTETEKWAREIGVHRLELTVMVHNEAGLALYKKMGFTIEGIARDSMLVDGKYVDEYYMAKILS
ncbi:GNAT family N-acetyltransferase [Alicyclobacillus fastidiosus]|uniref:GNAT family N-acetyltransferase n=1 Tax=Alicyclobacillus fastidiosus TaxID=392011 RepID=A0ABY6ZHT7_9BACL|nr:GNAT family N-acetyltransferase [Alicyclobacillus fastidiosus]WAH42376.1 GNAT family N-acetyltransferase [Alicyclobacillus fastidiosus]GMA64190.1 N-acetyltransferase [Alicyclobacillus fastidiosus]